MHLNLETCTLAHGPRRSDGYVRVSIGGGKTQLAHRLAWERKNGAIPDGMLVCHKCDNPPCCNIDHLFLGTAAENNRDRHAKGRSRGLFPSGEGHPAKIRGGERHWRAKLTDENVREIRRLYDQGKPHTFAASKFSINRATICRIARRLWRKEVSDA